MDEKSPETQNTIKDDKKKIYKVALTTALFAFIALGIGVVIESQFQTGIVPLTQKAGQWCSMSHLDEWNDTNIKGISYTSYKNMMHAEITKAQKSGVIYKDHIIFTGSQYYAWQEIQNKPEYGDPTEGILYTKEEAEIELRENLGLVKRVEELAEQTCSEWPNVDQEELKPPSDMLFLTLEESRKPLQEKERIYIAKSICRYCKEAHSGKNALYECFKKEGMYSEDEATGYFEQYCMK
jgi:hypothetical protein